MNDETELIPCPQCSENFNPWASKGKGQKFPYKRCFNCKAQDVPRENYGQQTSDRGSSDVPASSEGVDKRLDDMGAFMRDEFRMVHEALDDIKNSLDDRQ